MDFIFDNRVLDDIEKLGRRQLDACDTSDFGRRRQHSTSGRAAGCAHTCRPSILPSTQRLLSSHFGIEAQHRGSLRKGLGALVVWKREPIGDFSLNFICTTCSVQHNWIII